MKRWLKKWVKVAAAGAGAAIGLYILETYLFNQHPDTEVYIIFGVVFAVAFAIGYSEGQKDYYY